MKFDPPPKWLAFHASWHIFSFFGIEATNNCRRCFEKPCSVGSVYVDGNLFHHKNMLKITTLKLIPLECICWTFSIIEPLNKNRVGIIHRLHPPIQTPKSNDINRFHHPNHFHHLHPGQIRWISKTWIKLLFGQKTSFLFTGLLQGLYSTLPKNHWTLL